MENLQGQAPAKIPQVAVAALILGIATLAVLALSVLAGFLIEAVGIIQFFGLVAALGAAALILGIIALQKIRQHHLPGRKMAVTGIILGAVAILLTIVIRVAVFIFFIPWLGH